MRSTAGPSARSSAGASGGTSDPLAPLRVIERLEVGPAIVERNRLRMPYRVTRGRKADARELVYRFEEDVFDPGEADSHNLAGMIGAQVALNYGLFCEEIVFHGPFDAIDRRFLIRFTENTSREIYVNKFLSPNPFLVGAAAELPTVRQNRYTAARLVFPDEPSPERTDGSGARTRPAARQRHAVLSSGGKDSLLSFGLLRELGLAPQPIFVNESGRHWYTALNAYRHMAKTVPATARVWTDSDRLFAWMLRHLPFVRKDFGRVRADIYPIRLWTVAVFAFGALPLMRRRGIDRLVIGDEFDTTERLRRNGITHHAGLYDQSRWFDEALTRYFQHKGWGLSQFSVLRPLSELLIEKILVERYPDLQRHQVSCHAAHLDQQRVRPCGECEKCRRIVGMLVALGADTSPCGYTAEQVARCLRALGASGVHQEDAGARQLAYMLAARGRIEDQAAAALRAEPHPEVLALRFDRTRSPHAAVPADLRERLYRIFLQHANGAVERRGRVFVAADPLSPATLAQPYPFEASEAVARVGRARTSDEPTKPAERPMQSQKPKRKKKPTGPASSPAARRRRPWLLGELTWPEARARFKEVDVALLPVGAIEQHGPHLPLDTDAFDADYLARRVAEACSAPRPLVLPLLPYGVSYHHEDFRGTLSVSPDTQARLVYEIGIGAARNGVTKLVIVNGHGGNGPALHLAAQMINKDAHIFTCVDSGETSDVDVNEMAESHNDVHAGEIETSTTLAIRPELVRMDKAPRSVPRFSSAFLDFTSKRSVGWYAHTHKISRDGVMGDATKATREKGERMWEVMIRRLVELVEDLKSMSLDQIYQRRY